MAIIPRKLLVVDAMVNRWRWQTYVHRLLWRRRKRTSNLSSLILSGAELRCKWIGGEGWVGGENSGEPQRQERDSQHAIISNYLKINVSGSDPKLIMKRLFINVIMRTQSVEGRLYTPTSLM